MKYYKGHDPNVDYSVVQPAPGHGKPLNFWAPSAEDASGGVAQPFPSAFLKGNVSKSEEMPDMEDEVTKAFLPILTTRELLMLQFMNAATDRPNWQTQVFDEAVVSQWKEDLASELFDYCIQELRHKAKGIYQDPNAPIIAYNGNVLKADLPTYTVPLQDAVRVWEDVPDWQKDRCGPILNLVDPSLFPLVYEKTRALKVGSKVVGIEDCVTRCGEGEVLAKLDAPLDENTCYEMEPISLLFQWLPCDVTIGGDSARIISYINNLHPKHTALYQVIEDVVNAAIPLWKRSLSPLYGDFTWGEPKFFKRIAALKEVTYSDNGEIAQPVPSQFEPSVFDKGLPRPLNFRTLYGKSGKPLQVIVKLFNIELTPDNTQYHGEPWHIEGQQNEYICATTFYCYSSSNVRTPQLAFRQLVDGSQFDQDFEYEPGEHDFLKDYFGCDLDTGGVQDVGTVEHREGRTVTFPNLLLHRLKPFELEDATREGHLKILQLSLVEPRVRVIGTSDVPAQQRHWWREAIEASKAGPNVQGLDRLPTELKDRVFNSVESFPISLEEAKVLRKELLEERERYVADHANAVGGCNDFYLE